MNYQIGLSALARCLQGDAGHATKLHTLEFRLINSLDQERLFGTNENTRSEIAQIIYSLNDLALRNCGVSFTDLCRGVKCATLPQQLPPDVQQHSYSGDRRSEPIVFRMQLSQIGRGEIELRVLESESGEPRAKITVPFSQEDLLAVEQVLAQRNLAGLTASQLATLARFGLLTDSRLFSDYLVRLGRVLYSSLFPEDVGTAFAQVCNRARASREPVSLQLRIDVDDTLIASYPWELIHDGQQWLAASGVVEVSRYVPYRRSVTTTSIDLPARLLYIECRPKDLISLPRNVERLAAWNALQPLAESGQITLQRLEKPTYNSLLNALGESEYDMIHFDGHGVQMKQCQECGSMSEIPHSRCQNCGSSLPETRIQSFLAFEDSEGKADMVSAQDMEMVFSSRSIRLVMLSACYGSRILGGNGFGTISPALIRAGVPAVVAMQYEVPVQATINFAESFYTAISRGESISRAVSEGRRRLFRDDTWFIPTLHLRTHDHEGRLFTV